MKSNLTSPVARFSVTNLEAGAQYQAALYSYNSKGRSEPVILQAATLRLPEKQLTAEKGKLATCVLKDLIKKDMKGAHIFRTFKLNGRQNEKRSVVDLLGIR